MMSAGSAVSESSTAPRTDCSASRFCGGATGPSGMRGGGARPFVVRSGMLTAPPSLGTGSDRTYVLRANSERRHDVPPERERPPRWAAARTVFRSRCGALLLLDHHGLDG